jgi:ABC-type nitrate/sulfonate/bicarbonate transport system ATPase subunit/ABC-type multidrug transport system permease subunit
LFYQLGNTQTDARTRVGALFFSILQPVFENFSMVAVTFLQRPIFYQQRKNSYFEAPLYSISNLASDALLSLFLRLIFSAIAYPMIGLSGGFSHFLLYWFVSTLTTIGSRAWMTIVASYIALEPVAGLAAPITLVVWLLFAGFVVPLSSIPIGWKWLHHCSFLKYAFQALMINEFSQNNALVCTDAELMPGSADVLLNIAPPLGFGGARSCPYSSGSAFVQASFDIDSSSFGGTLSSDAAWLAFLVLLVFVMGLVALAVFVQWYCDHSKLPSASVPAFRDLAASIRQSSSDQSSVESTSPSGSNVLTIQTDSDPASKASPVRIVFHDLCYSVDGKLLLNNAFGAVLPGSMVALMGSSGAGKTTLLDVLAGRKTQGTMTGTLLVNGAPRDLFFSRYSGYVEQFDSHLPTSTVREAVRFSADLRLTPPWNTTGTARDASAAERADFEADKDRKVQQMLDSIGLSGVADRIIGMPEMGGLSHEIRKRVTIAVELITEPRVLFLGATSPFFCL